jgi:hypothetical protein
MGMRLPSIWRIIMTSSCMIHLVKFHNVPQPGTTAPIKASSVLGTIR